MWRYNPFTGRTTMAEEFTLCWSDVTLLPLSNIHKILMGTHTHTLTHSHTHPVNTNYLSRKARVVSRL